MDHTDIEKATFAAGCFWGIEEVFRSLKGVEDTKVGYLGGTTEHPTYEGVCSGTSGHAEVVQVFFRPSVVTYEDLLNVFWQNHNPTTLNRQGLDVGEQYRSAIFVHSSDQEKTARASKNRLDESGKYRVPIVTQIKPATVFYRAEEYHQRYLEKRGQGQCRI